MLRQISECFSMQKVNTYIIFTSKYRILLITFKFLKTGHWGLRKCFIRKFFGNFTLLQIFSSFKFFSETYIVSEILCGFYIGINDSNTFSIEQRITIKPEAWEMLHFSLSFNHEQTLPVFSLSWFVCSRGIENLIPLKPVLGDVRDVITSYYLSWIDSINASLVFNFHFFILVWLLLRDRLLPKF